MRNLKLLIMTIVLAVFLAGVAGLAQAGDDNLMAVAKKFKELYGGSEGVRLMKNLETLKQIGLSYQESILLPLEGVTDCKDQEQLRILLGMYMADSNYAMVFGKNKRFLEARQVANKQVLDRLEARSKMEAPKLDPELMKRYAENPNDAANREALMKSFTANWDVALSKAEKEPSVMDVAVDTAYGATLENLFLVCKLTLSTDVGENVLALFNHQLERQEKLGLLLQTVNDPELTKISEQKERLAESEPIKKIILAKKGRLSPEDIKQILALVEPIRNKLIGKCK